MKAATKLFCNAVAGSLISIHAAREGGDLRRNYFKVSLAVFQSTPPVKAATYMGYSFFNDIGFQSTPPVKAATDYTRDCPQPCNISIHAAREGGDKKERLVSDEVTAFQSTPPVKAATSPL